MDDQQKDNAYREILAAIYTSKKKIAAWFSFGAIGTALVAVNPEGVLDFLNEALKHQVVSFTVAFSLAAWIHSGRVKKEIKNQFESLVTAITGLGEKLENRIENVEEDIKKIKHVIGIGELK